MQFLNKAKATLSEAADAVGDKVDDVKTALPDAPDFINELAAQAEAWADEKKAILERFKQEKIDFVQNFVRQKLEGIFDFGMEVAANKVKENIKDPYMPMVVQGWVDDLVDGLLPDVKVEMKDAILERISKTQPLYHGEKPGCPGNILAWVRYSLMPYDRSVWRVMRHPLWWLFLILSLIPKYGLTTIMYLIQFIYIDKSDEFQLFIFITDFKSLQFATLGIATTMVGAVQYYVCVTTSPTNCKEYAPRENIWTMVVFIANIFLVWGAFIAMAYSTKKGGFHHQYEQSAKASISERVGSAEGRTAGLNNVTAYHDEQDNTDNTLAALRFQTEGDMLEKSRGRLKNFLIYDFCVFLLCLALVLFVAFANFLDDGSNVEVNDTDTYNNSNWKFTMALYWIKALYGLLSFPFIALKLPLINSLITHAKPTGYNPYGFTMPFINKEEEGPVPWDPERGVEVNVV